MYAEGRIEAATTQVLTIINSAIARDGDKTYVWAIQDGVLKKQVIVLGERDVRRGDFAIVSGLKNGDKVVRQPLSTFKDGLKVTMVASAGVNKATAGAAPTSATTAASASASATVAGK